MSKTHPPKSKTAKKTVPAKTAPKAVTKKAQSKAPAKKSGSGKSPTQGAAKKQPLKTATPAKKIVSAKKAPAAKTVVAKKAAPAKKATSAKKVAPVKKPAAVKKAIPAKKDAVAKKPDAATKKVPVIVEAPPVMAAPPLVKAEAPAPVKPTPAPVVKSAASSKAGGKTPAAPVVVAAPIAPPKPPVMSDEKPVAVKSGALFYDSHMHTPLCKHAWGEPEEYAAQALKSGLKGIIFTCHCPMPDGFWPTVRMSDSEFDTYVSMVQRTAQAYKGKLDVCLGLESEFFPGHEKWIENLHKRADFDYILGAVHWQSKDYLAKYETGTIENFRRTYFEHLAQSAETGLYDCVAHPDLVKNYHPDSWCFAIIKNTVSTVLDRIAKTGVAMELNTSGLNKSYSEMNPGNEMLRMMAERKIPVVLGSDSHKPVRVGEHFITALNNLSDAGYEEISYFKKRQRIDLRISDVLASIRKAIDANS